MANLVQPSHFNSTLTDGAFAEEAFVPIGEKANNLFLTTKHLMITVFGVGVCKSREFKQIV